MHDLVVVGSKRVLQSDQNKVWYFNPKESYRGFNIQTGNDLVECLRLVPTTSMSIKILGLQDSEVALII